MCNAYTLPNSDPRRSLSSLTNRCQRIGLECVPQSRGRGWPRVVKSGTNLRLCKLRRGLIKIARPRISLSSTLLVHADSFSLLTTYFQNLSHTRTEGGGGGGSGEEAGSSMPSWDSAGRHGSASGDASLGSGTATTTRRLSRRTAPARSATAGASPAAFGGLQQ